jgi:hypothetical protein
MSNNKQSSVEWLINKIDCMLPTYLIEQAKQIEAERMQEQYQDGREIGKIEILTTQSTSNASAYSEGYNKGFLAALEYMNSTIENKIKVRQ